MMQPVVPSTLARIADDILSNFILSDWWIPGVPKLFFGADQVKVWTNQIAAWDGKECQNSMGPRPETS